MSGLLMPRFNSNNRNLFLFAHEILNYKTGGPGGAVDGDHHVRFVEPSVIASLHERGVDLGIDSAAARQLPPPEHAAPVFDEDPGEMSTWDHWVHKLTRRGMDWKRER